MHDHLGVGTLSPIQSMDADAVTDRIQVNTVKGDDLLASEPTPPKLIKIDVEGYELRALQGLERCISTWRPAIVTELVSEHLRRAGTDRAEVNDLMQGCGYTPYGLETRSVAGRHRLRLVPVSGNFEKASFDDYIWLCKESSATPVLEPYIDGPDKAR